YRRSSRVDRRTAALLFAPLHDREDPSKSKNNCCALGCSTFATPQLRQSNTGRYILEVRKVTLSKRYLITNKTLAFSADRSLTILKKHTRGAPRLLNTLS